MAHISPDPVPKLKFELNYRIRLECLDKYSKIH